MVKDHGYGPRHRPDLEKRAHSPGCGSAGYICAVRDRRGEQWCSVGRTAGRRGGVCRQSGRIGRRSCRFIAGDNVDALPDNDAVWFAVGASKREVKGRVSFARKNVCNRTRADRDRSAARGREPFPSWHCERVRAGRGSRPTAKSNGMTRVSKPRPSGQTGTGSQQQSASDRHLQLYGAATPQGGVKFKSWRRCYRPFGNLLRP